MIICSTRLFARWARKQRIDDDSLCTAVQEMESGLIDVDLGGGLFKKRIARKGQGKRGGFRTLIASNRDDKWFFVYGFAKNERDNIEDDEEEALKLYAGQLLSLADVEIALAIIEGKLVEIENG